MDCSEFEKRLEDTAAGTLPPAVHAAVQEHLAQCPRCGGLLDVAVGRIDSLPAESQAELTNLVMLHTSGPACQRAHEYLCDFVDGTLGQDDTELMAGHVQHCVNCRELASTLAALRELLPGMAELEPDSAFTQEVVDLTTMRPPAHTSGWRLRLHDWWYRLMERPRFSWEAAYIGTLLLIAVWGNPALPWRHTPTRLLASVRVDAQEIWRSGTQVYRQAGGWLDQAEPTIRGARELPRDLKLRSLALAEVYDSLQQRSLELWYQILHAYVTPVPSFLNKTSADLERWLVE